MPTPFTHLAIAQRYLKDDRLDASIRDALKAQEAAFLLGNTAADAHFLANLQREQTHFYRYDKPIVEHPWHKMIAEYPALEHPDNATQRAFIAGYIAHLSVDEWFAMHVTRVHFALTRWAPDKERFTMLNVILTVMDERDQQVLTPDLYQALAMASPATWLPFLPDQALIQWRDLLAKQLSPEGESLTLPIIAPRIHKSVPELRQMLDSQDYLNEHLWQHVPADDVAKQEAAMYDFAWDQVIQFWSST